MSSRRSGLPSRDDFRLQDLGHTITQIVVMEIQSNPMDFTYLLIGSGVEGNLSQNYTGKSLSKLPGKGPESRIWENMKITMETREPLFCEVPYVGPRVTQQTLHTLYLPLASDGKTPDRILIVPSFSPKYRRGLFTPHMHIKAVEVP